MRYIKPAVSLRALVKIYLIGSRKEYQRAGLVRYRRSDLLEGGCRPHTELAVKSAITGGQRDGWRSSGAVDARAPATDARRRPSDRQRDGGEVDRGGAAGPLSAG